MNPFKIEGPAYVSFSGGRTSALMLRRVIDAGLDPDVHVIYGNTGKEREETLVFIDRCAKEWGVNVRWLEYVAPPVSGGPSSYREVSFATASRLGEPFEALIDHVGMVPNVVASFCTTELKHRLARHFMTGLGYAEWSAAVGIRFDEKRRWGSRGKKIEGGRVEMPLVDARVTLADVDAFWGAQRFRLELEPHEGNCDACFKKAQWKVQRVIADDPRRGDWWAAQESRTNTRFRIDRSGYAAITDVARRQLPIVFDTTEDDSLPCGCAA